MSQKHLCFKKQTTYIFKFFSLLALIVGMTACGSSSSSSDGEGVDNTNEDITPPVISIIGTNPLRIQLGTAYTEEGASANDNVDGDISNNITTTGSVDASALGSYTISYAVEDAAGNLTEVDRTVTVFNNVPTFLNQAVYETGSTYRYGYNSFDIPISGAPVDTDRTRWAMLNDVNNFRLYFFKVGSNTTLYQFAFNFVTQRYEYGYNSIGTIELSGMPVDANTDSFAMLYDGTDYRLYMLGKTNPAVIYQAAYNPNTLDYEYGYNSNDFSITNAPANADFSRWAMLHDGTDYRLYLLDTLSATTFYQFVFTDPAYDWGGNASIKTLSIVGMPNSSDTESFSMLHDGVDYRFYFQRE